MPTIPAALPISVERTIIRPNESVRSRAVVEGMGQTVLMVTHDPVAASAAHSVLFLADGKLAGHLPHPTPERVAERMTHLGEW